MRYLKDIGQYIVFGLFVLGIIMVYATLRTGNYNIYILGTGILLIAIPTIVYFIRQRIDTGTGATTKSIEELKKFGIKVPVNFDKCLIKTNNWTDEVPRYDNSRVEFWNEIGGDADKNVERVEFNLARIEYTCDINGQRKTFVSPTISKDETTLKLLLALHKETTIYIDPSDKKRFYFDLEFLTN